MPLRLFEDWQTNIVRPILISVTGAVVFAGLGFTAGWLTFSNDVPEYPLACFAEPYVREGSNAKELSVDFYVINPTSEGRDRKHLQNTLKLFNPNPRYPLQPDVLLKVKSPEVRILSVHNNADFNRDKGEVTGEIQNDARAIKIMIRNVAAYSILKITIDFANVSRARLAKAVFRASNGVLPVEFDHRCYQAS